MGSMFMPSSVFVRDLRPMSKRLARFGLLAMAALFVGAACEDQAIGRACDLTVDAAGAQGAYNSNATDCPSRLCIKPAVQPGVSQDLDTGAYCTIQCKSDGDCSGQTRDPSNPNDTRCRKGFTCAIPFGKDDTGKGDLCCAKLCLCRDFFSASVGPATPDVCKSDSTETCS
jgi:hypothetical protein